MDLLFRVHQMNREIHSIEVNERLIALNQINYFDLLKVMLFESMPENILRFKKIILLEELQEKTDESNNTTSSFFPSTTHLFYSLVL